MAERQLAAVYQPHGPDGRLVDVSAQNTRPGVVTVHPLGYFCGGEGLVSSCGDFYKFAAALHNHGAPPPGAEGRRFLSTEAAAVMTTNQLPSTGMRDFPSASASQRALGFGMGVSVSLGPDEADGTGQCAPPSPPCFRPPQLWYW